MRKLSLLILILIISVATRAQENGTLISTRASDKNENLSLSIKTNIVPWAAAIPNLEAELAFSKHWSGGLDVWYSPWKISNKYAVKTLALFPRMSWWIKENVKGHHFDIHLTVGWYNVRFNKYRYQDTSRPLLGGGLGYGYRFMFNTHWGLDLNLSLGYVNMKYDRFYNIPNGALTDTRVSNYIGVDYIGVTLVYNIGDL